MRLIVVVATLLLSGQLVACSSAAEKLSLASPFTDHAVLQRETAVPVWGRAEPKATVVVKFAGQTKSAQADENGRWTVKLDALAVSADPQTLTVTTDPASETLTRSDILVGDVWLCSGQSNMGFNLDRAIGGPETAKEAGDKQLRLFNAGARQAEEPAETIGGKWEYDSPETALKFSAVAYYFGKELRTKTGVPIGLIRSAIGGTVAEAWTPKADLEKNPTLVGLYDVQAKKIAEYPKALEAWKAKEADALAKWQDAVAKAKAEGKNPPQKPKAPDDPAKNNNRPSVLYNGSIAPLVPYAIRGAIWYQGESNSGRGKEYQTLFPAMIGAWRSVWKQGDFPFLFVQITPHKNMTPEVREAQRFTAETTQNTAMAVTTDIGDADDIHPRDKKPIGVRLALAAEALAYGKAVEFSGPTYDSIKVDGNKAILTFTHVGKGLEAKGGDLKGFTIAGKDGQFVPAAAKIEGEKIVVSASSVAEPVQVRYGWTNVPDVNLWNKDGLPASPFQSDVAWTLEPGFESLFNGKDLTGWKYKTSDAFDGKQHADDGRYSARDGELVVNPGKGLAQLSTVRQFPKDFHLKLEFRAGVNADSGIFIREPQLQCRDYLVAGPFKDLKKYKPQDWNEIEVIVKGTEATCTCNGEPITIKNPLPTTGPIGLEADRGQMEYRRIRVKAL